MELTKTELNRYHRTIILPGVGPEGQLRLKKSAVLVVGAGGLGSPVSLYLAAAGVGTIGIIDFDVLEESNLQRQILHKESSLGTGKVDSAKKELSALNSHIKVNGYRLRAETLREVEEIVKDYDIVVSAVDNYQTRIILNQASLKYGRPLVDAGVRGFEGYIATIIPGETPCYQCIFPPPIHSVENGGPPTGVLPTVPAVLGSLQANEVLKILLNIGDKLTGKMLLVDLLKMSFNIIELKRKADCPACGGKNEL